MIGHGDKIGLKTCIIWLMAAAALGSSAANASNHLDTPTVIANPQANIGDIYAWMSPDAQHLNLIMDIVGHSFSDKLTYTFHIDSGSKFGKTKATATIVCRFPAMHAIDCRFGRVDQARGDASDPAGIGSRKGTFRVFAGLRDDPFFNNVRGTRAAYNEAFGALADGAQSDGAGCPSFPKMTTDRIGDAWRHTDGGPATNFLARWTTSALVISIDTRAVSKGGKLLAIWGATATTDRQLDRLGRPLTKNSLLGLTHTEKAGIDDEMKERWNRLTPQTSREFIAELQTSLGFYDGLDGKCGNQWLADMKLDTPVRYQALATLLDDDRLWVNSASGRCTQLFAVELSSVGGRTDLDGDCGGRAPIYNASNVWRSLLVNGATTGTDDGLDHDEHRPSSTEFPFLAPPDAQPIER
jgi:hypothetical protein